MSGSSAHLTLFSERCDGCGACRDVCSTGALKVGAGFIYVDWRRCDGCQACVEACERHAIVSRTVPLRSGTTPTTVPLSEVSKVVVGSRAEAKAVRRAAELAAKSKKKGGHEAASPVAPKAARRSAAAIAAADAPSARPASTVELRPLVDGAEADRDPSAAEKLLAQRAREGSGSARDTESRPAVKPPSSLALPSLPANSGSPTAWTLVDLGAVLVIALAALLAKNAVLALKAIALMPVLGRTVVRVVVLVAFYVGQFAGLGWLAARHGRPALTALGLRRTADAHTDELPSVLGSVGLVAALLVGCEAVAIGYSLVMRALGSQPPPMLSSDLSSVFGSGPAGLAVAALLVALAAPFAEEIVFRGIVMPALGDRWGAWVGIGGSALLFAAYHLQPWLAFPMLVFGAALGWLSWTRRSLWPAIALHVLFNTLSIMAAFAAPR